MSENSQQSWYRADFIGLHPSVMEYDVRELLLPYYPSVCRVKVRDGLSLFNVVHKLKYMPNVDSLPLKDRRRRSGHIKPILLANICGVGMLPLFQERFGFWDVSLVKEDDKKNASKLNSKLAYRSMPCCTIALHSKYRMLNSKCICYKH